MGHFWPPGSGSGSSRPISMRIQIRNTVANKVLSCENERQPSCVTDSTFLATTATRNINIWFCYLGLLLSASVQPALKDTTLPSLEPSTSQTMPKIIKTEFLFFVDKYINDVPVRVREVLISLSKCRMYDVLMKLAACVTTFEDVRTTVWRTDVTYVRSTKVPYARSRDKCTMYGCTYTRVMYVRIDVRR